MGFWSGLKQVLNLAKLLEENNKKLDDLIREVVNLRQAIDSSSYFSQKLDTIIKYSEREIQLINTEKERLLKEGERKNKKTLEELEKAKELAVSWYKESKKLQADKKTLSTKVRDLENRIPKVPPFLGGATLLGQGTTPPLSVLSQFLHKPKP